MIGKAKKKKYRGQRFFFEILQCFFLQRTHNTGLALIPVRVRLDHIWPNSWSIQFLFWLILSKQQCSDNLWSLKFPDLSFPRESSQHLSRSDTAVNQGCQICHSNGVRLATNGTNLWLFKSSVSTFWLGDLNCTETDLMGQIWGFLRSVSVYFGSASQNLLKLILISPRFVLFGANLSQFGCQIWHPYHSVYRSELIHIYFVH